MTKHGVKNEYTDHKKRSSSHRNSPPFAIFAHNEPLHDSNASALLDNTQSADNPQHGGQGCSLHSFVAWGTRKDAKAPLTFVPIHSNPTEQRGTKRKSHVSTLARVHIGRESSVPGDSSISWSSGSRSNDRDSLMPITHSSSADRGSSVYSAESPDIASKRSANSKSDEDWACPSTECSNEDACASFPQLSNQLVTEHATVVAHLTPRRSDCSGIVGSNYLFETDPGSLVPVNCDPCFQVIRKTFHRLAKPEQHSSDPSSDQYGEPIDFKRKHRSAKGKARAKSPNPDTSMKKICIRMDNGSDDSGGSSGSGTEGGYAASSSSTERDARMGSCSSPTSEDSSEDSGNEQQNHGKPKFSLSGDPKRPMLSKKLDPTHSSSSEIADFSSGTSEVETDSSEVLESPSISCSSNGCDPSDDEELQSNLESQYQVCAPSSSWLQPSRIIDRNGAPPTKKPKAVINAFKEGSNTIREHSKCGDSHPIMNLGCDIMAHILTFLHSPDILNVLTMPISKTWLATYSRQSELWRVLCLLEPFKAKFDQDNDSNECVVSFPFNDESGRKQYFGRFRLLYTSFVRCMRYLIRIKEDAVNGRPTSANDFGTLDGRYYNISANRSLHHFLSQARGAIAGAAYTTAVPRLTEQVARAVPVNLSDKESLTTSISITKKDSTKINKAERKVRYGHSKLTQRLLGPAANGIVRDVELPWSCGIFSIVNWMVAFTDVEGIQTMCLKVLPFLLENEQQRVTGQRAGLTDIVLRAMVLFPDSSHLHTAAFHTIVLLARPLGGQEGMLLHTSMVSSFGIFSSQGGSQDGRSGVAVLLDSMRRFRSDNLLQSMGCWSLVNVALAPSQKMVLVALGGIEVITQAMTDHPYDAELQFRALFALINLVIPSIPSSLERISIETRDVVEAQSGAEILDEMVNQIAHLVVLAMKNFSSNEAILNRACLVLHNLSLTPECNEALLWTPGCYQMLEWCLANYRTDQVLQQSAAGTLHRLQTTLSRSEGLRERFNASIRAQQQSSLERAHAEAVLLHQHYSDDTNEDPGI
jgi:hypothetical protein